MVRTTARDVRLANRAALLRALWFDGRMSRVEIAGRTALSPATVTNLVGALLAEGLVVETGRLQPDVGRPATLVQVRSGARAVIGVEIREGAVAVGLFDLMLASLASVDEPMGSRPPTGETYAEVIGTIARDLLRRTGTRRETVLGIGVAVPGLVDEDGEIRVHAPRLGWDGVLLAELISQAAELPVRLENDAKALGFMEAFTGDGPEHEEVVVCLLGTGVGASILVGGRLLRGTSGTAGEWGHTTVVLGGERCSCGASGCLEAYAGAPAILRRWGAASVDGPRLAGNQEEDIRHLARLAAGGDAVAMKVIRETATYIGAALADLINLLNPRRVVIGGWVAAELGPVLLPLIQQEARARALAPPMARVSIGAGTCRGPCIPAAAATLVVERFLAAGGVTPPRVRAA